MSENPLTPNTLPMLEQIYDKLLGMEFEVMNESQDVGWHDNTRDLMAELNALYVLLRQTKSYTIGLIRFYENQE